MIRIGFLGPLGTFSEVAAWGYVSRKGWAPVDVTLVPAPNIASLFKMMDGDDACDRVIVPIENSIEGPVIITQDMLIQTSDLKIEEEFSIPIVNQLLVLPGVDWQSITDVISHPQPLGQCQRFLKTAFPTPPRLHVADSTSSAARMVGNRQPVFSTANPETTAAIGSDRLAEVYGLEIAVPDIQDSDTNRTRFWVLSRCASAPTGRDKTTLIFSTLRDQPGGLHDVLGEFALQGINLTSIGSRPTKLGLGEYLFIVDFIGHQIDPIVQYALEAIRSKTSYFKVVGSYKRDSEESVC